MIEDIKTVLRRRWPLASLEIEPVLVQGQNAIKSIVSGLRKACAKRPIPSRTVDKMAEEIESELSNIGLSEIPSASIGETVMDRLSKLDRVAYIRYASVYRAFQDLESFEAAVKDLREHTSVQ